MLYHIHIGKSADQFIIYGPGQIDQAVFLAGGLDAAYDFIALFPLMHKNRNQLHRVLEIGAERYGAVPGCLA